MPNWVQLHVKPEPARFILGSLFSSPVANEMHWISNSSDTGLYFIWRNREAPDVKCITVTEMSRNLWILNQTLWIHCNFKPWGWRRIAARLTGWGTVTWSGCLLNTGIQPAAVGKKCTHTGRRFDGLLMPLVLVANALPNTALKRNVETSKMLAIMSWLDAL